MTKIKEYYKQAKINATKELGQGYDYCNLDVLMFLSLIRCIIFVFTIFWIANYIVGTPKFFEFLSGGVPQTSMSSEEQMPYIIVIEFLKASVPIIGAISILYFAGRPFFQPLVNVFKTILGDLVYRIDQYLKQLGGKFFSSNKENSDKVKRVLPTSKD